MDARPVLWAYFVSYLIFEDKGFHNSFASAPLTHSYSLRSLKNGPLLLSSSIQYNPLDICATTPLDTKLSSSKEGWSAVLKLLQRHFCV